jgi:ABC-type polysaccharide transport system permease subunit
MMLIPLVHLLVFRYGPMYGAIIAFKDFNPVDGVLGSPWVGFKHFVRFFRSFEFYRVISNTVTLNLLVAFGGLPIPVIIALGLNMIARESFKKTVQMISYIPYFISTVIMATLIIKALDPRYGVVTLLLRSFGFAAQNILGEASLFRAIYFVSAQWQHSGYSSIVYLAALSGVSQELHEAAIIDGANKRQRILNVDLPGILPTIVIIIILRAGQVMNVEFEKVFLLQNTLNLATSEVISTYVYKLGLLNTDFSLATAIGLFNSAVNLVLIVAVNGLARKLGRTSLW